MKYENQILDAIDVIVENAVNKAGYDKTIQAKIIRCEDPTIGKYKVSYQNSSFYAYSGSSEIGYAEGTVVYILVPNGDMSKDKTILGSTTRLGVNYATSAQGEEAFEVIGNNCIESNNYYELCSYKTTKDYIIYEYGKNSDIRLNLTSINNYIRSSTSIILAAKFRTNLPIEQQFRGNYGIVYEMVFSDNGSEELVTRNYVLDINQFEGNPYKISNLKRQVGIFDIDGANFKYINKIYLMCYDFPNQSEEKDNDIFIEDLEICGSTALSAKDLESCSLSFITPQGTYFDDNDLSSATRTIQAQVRVKGKYIDPSSQTLPYYWFVEDNGITSLSEKYNSYGGQGWKCLNNSNIIKESIDGVAPVVEWIPNNHLYTIRKSDSAARETKYKCVVIYNNIIVSRQFIITNYSSNYDIAIESDGGNQFYYDIGNPTLTCKVNGEERINSDYTYQWAVIDNNNNFYSLAETDSLNADYTQNVSRYNTLKAAIAAETKYAAASQEELNTYLTNINSYDKIMRVERNRVIHLQVNTITNFATYKCSVYYKGVFIGTSSIIIKNDLDKQDAYTLVINNGTQVFKYNEVGVSPTSDSLDSPQVILPLDFTIYDNLGNPLEESVIKNCKIQWAIPLNDTMLKVNDTYDWTTIDDYKILEDELSIQYSIRDKYDVKRTNNTIKLIVDYKGMNLVAETDFTFVKEGEPGTNGTDFVCKIVPNTQNTNFGYPMVINGNINYTPRQNNKWFNVQLWHSGDKIFEGNSTGNTTEGKSAKVEWKVLRNKYTSTLYDTTSLSITTNGTCGYSSYQGASSPANIVKVTVTYDDIEYYATLPVITATAVSGYKVSLVESSGFRYAVYSADGRKPQYNNSNPFELKVTKIINGVTEDISNLTKTNAVNYDWHIRGRIYNPVNSSWVTKEFLKEYKRTGVILNRNQASYKPIDDFDGECVTNGLECIILNNSAQEVARIHIPIHLLLNKYGNTAINGWDGNSVSIDKNGNGVILAPQVGAGQKESDNSFTGMLMGKVKEAGKNKTDIGLFSYNFGTRSIFLNAEDGSAIFGKKGPGQIILDPNSSKAMLYSSSYWKNYGDDGKPSSYNRANKSDGGMLIDLTTPLIEWGNGNFSVDSNGYLTAKGGGSIAGFRISDNTLIGGSGTGTVGMCSQPGVEWAFWTGSTQGANAPFHVGHDGSLNSTKGTIGGWTINGTELLSNNGNIHITSSGTLRGPNWEINSSGVAYFRNVRIDNGGWSQGSNDLINYGSRFRVESNGTLHASNGQFSGNISGSSISGGSISGSSISGGSVSGAAITGGSLNINNKFKVDSNGNTEITDGIFNLGGWTLKKDTGAILTFFYGGSGVYFNGLGDAIHLGRGTSSSSGGKLLIDGTESGFTSGHSEDITLSTGTGTKTLKFKNGILYSVS